MRPQNSRALHFCSRKLCQAHVHQNQKKTVIVVHFLQHQRMSLTVSACVSLFILPYCSYLVFENFFYMADELRRGRMACEHFLDSFQKLNKCYFPWWPVHQQCNSSILAALIPLYFEGIQFQTQSPGKGTRSCRGALSPLPDLWTAQWGSWKLRPLKDYLDFSQAYWDNLRAKSLCSFHINLQSERCQSRVVHYVSVCILNECITECSHGVF